MKYRLLLFGFLSIQLYAQWSSDPDENLRLINWGDIPLDIVSDANGGAFFTTGFSEPINQPPWSVSHPYLLWINKYGEHNLDTVYRMLGKGDATWKAALFEDGMGAYFGVFTIKNIEDAQPAYTVYNDKIIVQKFDNFGNTLWGEGVYVTLDTTDNIAFEYALDGEGGCYISWNATDQWGIDHGRQVIQHLSNEGQRLWSDTGKVLCIDPFYTGSKPYKIISDGNKGIYINYSPNNQDYYYARIDYDGNILWQKASRIIRIYQEDIDIIADSSGNLFCVGFSTPENSLISYLLFESISPSGDYSSDLITLLESNASLTKIWKFINQDSLLVITWAEQISAEYINYFQVIDKNGNPRFNNKGIVLFNSGWYVNKKIINSGEDFILTCNNEALKLNIDGEYLWGNNPVIFTNRNLISPAFTSDGMGGFIVIWQGYELVGIFGQQVNVNGELGKVITSVDFKDINFDNNFSLHQNYPNPFNPNTKISWQSPVSGWQTLKVYDILGKEVSTLVNEYRNAGTYEIDFQSSANNHQLANGVYFYRLQIGDFVETKKMLLLK